MGSFNVRLALVGPRGLLPGFVTRRPRTLFRLGSVVVQDLHDDGDHFSGGLITSQRNAGRRIPLHQRSGSGSQRDVKISGQIRHAISLGPCS